MNYIANGYRFAELFKKYRLRSEIKSLAEFGDLLAEEGIIYENSLFTRWQNGERVPKDRRNLLSIIKIFCSKGGIVGVGEANNFIEASGQGCLTNDEELIVQQILDKHKGNLNKSIGRLIKEYRIRKNLTLKDVSLSMGWKNENLLYDIESNINNNLNKNPSREILNRLINILELSDEEKNNLLLTGNYLPSNNEISKILSYVSPIIENWPYPAAVLDFTWRMIAENRKSKEVFYQRNDEIAKPTKDFPNVLEIIFDPNYIMNQQSGEIFAKWKERQNEIVTQFIGEHKNRSTEQWYINLIQDMLDRNEFREIWNSVHQDKINLIVSHFGKKILPSPSNKGKILSYNFFVVPIYNDPRFEIEFYNPADLETFIFYHGQEDF